MLAVRGPGSYCCLYQTVGSVTGAATARHVPHWPGTCGATQATLQVVWRYNVQYIFCISNGKTTFFWNGKKYIRYNRPHMSGFSSVAGLTDILPRDIKARENLLWRGNPNWELSYYITQCCCFRLNNMCTDLNIQQKLSCETFTQYG